MAERIALALSNLQLREKLRDQAIRDPLTAMYNRRYFEETATRELLRAGESGSSVGVIMIDVDHFKRFNDSHGHEAGDAVLQRVGLICRATREWRMWSAATAGKNSSCSCRGFRWGDCRPRGRATGSHT